MTTLTATQTRARGESQAIRTAAIEYDRAVHTHGLNSSQANAACVAMADALIAHGIDDVHAARDDAQAEIEHAREYVHLTPDRLPRAAETHMLGAA